jgi:hypothetical protein
MDQHLINIFANNVVNVLVVVCFFCGLLRFNRLDIAGKIFLINIGVEAAEVVMQYLVSYRVLSDRYMLYTEKFFEPAGYVFICLYFNHIIDGFNKNKVGIIIAMVGIAIAIGQSIWGKQEALLTNDYFFVFKEFSIIAMSLFALYRIFLKREDLKVTQYAHFWLIALLLFDTTENYLSLLYSEYINTVVERNVYFVQTLTDGLEFIGISIVFVLYPKLTSGRLWMQ